MLYKLLTKHSIWTLELTLTGLVDHISSMNERPASRESASSSRGTRARQRPDAAEEGIRRTVELQSVHMILGQLLLVAAPKAMTAVSGGPHGPLFTTGTGHGFGVSLVAGRSTLDLSLTYIHRPKRSKWRLLERPIRPSISTSCYSPRP